MRLKCAFKSQYKNGFQKLLLIAVHVTKKSKNGGTYKHHKTIRLLFIIRLLIFFDAQINIKKFI